MSKEMFSARKLKSKPLKSSYAKDRSKSSSVVLDNFYSARKDYDSYKSRSRNN